MLRELPAAYGLLKGVELKRIATACGLASSGTKAEILTRLSTTLGSFDVAAASPRVLSIDLGLRNLAYSLVAPAHRLKLTSAQPSLPEDAVQRPIPVHLHAWRRHELVPKRQSDGAKPDDFTPSNLSSLALDLVKNHLLPLQPTHILLERQRFRTLGSSQVQEWTLRVNMLEAMLHAILRVMSDSGEWHGSVISVPPNRASNFWLEGASKSSTDEDAASEPVPTTTKAKNKKKKLDTKKHKIDLVANWLTEGNVAMAESHAVDTMVQSFLHHWKKTRRGRSKTGKATAALGPGQQLEDLAKLDDLADCLLQGMGWLIWQQNTAIYAQPDFEPQTSDEKQAKAPAKARTKTPAKARSGKK